jgi:citrate synthase
MNPSGDSDHEPTRTRLSRVDGQAGELIIGGFRLEDLAPLASFEEVVFLLWNDRLPTSDELRTFQEGMARERSLAPEARRALERASQSGAGSMDALRLAVESQALEPPASTADDLAAWRGQALRIVARMPMLAAAYARLRAGVEPVDPPAAGPPPPAPRAPGGRRRMERYATPSSTTG